MENEGLADTVDVRQRVGDAVGLWEVVPETERVRESDGEREGERDTVTDFEIEGLLLSVTRVDKVLDSDGEREGERDNVTDFE